MPLILMFCQQFPSKNVLKKNFGLHYCWDIASTEVLIFGRLVLC